MKARRLLAGHAYRREENSLLKIVISGRPGRPSGRPRLRWVDQGRIKMRVMGADEEVMQDWWKCRLGS